ncbi:MAG: hypothetical protein ABR537_06915 [Gemmatimonadales bacterium]
MKWVVAPNYAATSGFGQTLEGPLSGLFGVMLIYAVFKPSRIVKQRPSRGTMRLLPVVSLSVLLGIPWKPLVAQQVIIKDASPSDVVRAINEHISSQGFRLEDSSAKRALFSLDRGLVSQRTNSMVQSVPVVLELQLRFKPKPDGLQVDADEEVVGARGNRQFEFRRRVQGTAERETIQRLLETVKSDLEGRADSTAR